MKMSTNYRNRNRGYQSLRVWADAQDYYVATCPVFRNFPFELKRVASQQIASADSGHRNIAEGYCRRSRREYLNFLKESNLAYSLASDSEANRVPQHPNTPTPQV
jgi:hypothetical protein